MEGPNAFGEVSVNVASDTHASVRESDEKLEKRVAKQLIIQEQISGVPILANASVTGYLPEHPKFAAQ